VLKKNQLAGLLEKRQIPQYIAAIQNANLEAFGDIRNLIFDKHLGTSLLTHTLLSQRQRFRITKSLPEAIIQKKQQEGTLDDDNSVFLMMLKELKKLEGVF